MSESAEKQEASLPGFEQLLARVEKLERLISQTRASEIRSDALYLAEEAAEVLRCSKTNIYDLAESGALATTRVGAGKKCLRFRGSDILAFLDDRREGGPSPSPSNYRHIGRFLANSKH